MYYILCSIETEFGIPDDQFYLDEAVTKSLALDFIQDLLLSLYKHYYWDGDSLFAVDHHQMGTLYIRLQPKRSA